MKKIGWFARIATFLGICATTAASGVACAEDAAFSANGAAGTAGPEVALEEVVVTAERRSENLQKTPVSVSARTGEELQREGRFTLTDILEDIPGVSGFAGSGGGGGTDAVGTNILIRGVGSNQPASGGISSVVPATAIYTDGVVGGGVGSYDIDRVEVLRGPQGTLYGRSATAGVIAIHTRNPVLHSLDGNVTLEAGNYSLQHVSAGINLPLGDKWAVRVAADRYQRNGFNAEKGGSAISALQTIDTTAGRAKLLFQPNDAVSALLGVALEHDNTYSGTVTGNLTAPNTVTLLPIPSTSGGNNTRQFWAEVNWNLGPATLTYLPALRNWEQHAEIVSGGGALTLRAPQSTPFDQFHTQELRLASNGDSGLKWQTGVYYYNNRLRNQTRTTNVNTGAQLLAAVVQKETTNVGIFGEATLALTEALRVTAGLRYDTTKGVVAEDFTSASGVTRSLTSAEGTMRFYNTTYKLRLEGDLTASNVLYASISTGFLPGDVGVVNGTNGLPVVAPFDAETLTSFEVGSKNRFFNEQLQVNGSVYYYRYGGYQTAGVNISTNPAIPSYITLTSPARMAGIELEMLWQLTRADLIGLNFTQTNARYVDKPALFAANVWNERLAQVPPQTADLSYSHEFGLPRGQSLTVAGNVLYRSDYEVATISTAIANSGLIPYAQTSRQFTSNLNATWSLSPGRSITAYMRNVANNRYKYGASVTTAIRAGENSEPRTYGVVLNARF